MVSGRCFGAANRVRRIKQTDFEQVLRGLKWLNLNLQILRLSKKINLEVGRGEREREKRSNWILKLGIYILGKKCKTTMWHVSSSFSRWKNLYIQYVTECSYQKFFFLKTDWDIKFTIKIWAKNQLVTLAFSG